jgi:uncharacterized membrane protein YuzA (DUF378 family)
MSKMQAIIYLIVALAGFAALSYGFYKLMVAIFTQRYKKK